MFLVFALLLLALWVWLFLNVYASFFPFLESIGHISDYNVAYYSAISAVERWMLVTKYRAPGFAGSGWVSAWTGRGPASDQSLFFVTGDSQGNWWAVNSRTTTIPGSGEGNVDPFLTTGDSTQYNAMQYDLSETLLLSIDSTTAPWEYYSDVTNQLYFHWGTFSGEIRLPPFVVVNFSSGWANATLCNDSTSESCDSDGDGVYDEIKVVRWMKWKYLSSPFSIIPTLWIWYYSGMYIDTDNDNTLRASLINPSAYLEPHDYTFVANGSSLFKHTMISQESSSIETESFQTILWDGSYTELELSFGLVGLLRSFQWSIYPYLEYRLEFPQAIADRFYTIDGHGRNRNYDVQIQIKKPTVRGTVGGDFTVIF